MRYNNINVYAALFCGLAHAIFTSSNLKQIFWYWVLFEVHELIINFLF